MATMIAPTPTRPETVAMLKEWIIAWELANREPVPRT
jgi:hypothetical protein